jgi:hypothetical protein
MSLIKRKSTRAVCAAVALALTGVAAQAAEPAHKVMLSGYEDSVGGASLMAGDYQAVIAQLAPHGFTFWKDAVAASTNLCVASIMTKSWDGAQRACDEAIKYARLQDLGSDLYQREVRDEQVALAYSNRAVLHWLESQPQSAAADMARAQSLSPQSQFVSQNVARLGAVNTAQAMGVAAANRS